MDLELKGKTVVVTGGAKGIGAAIIRAAADEGANTVVIDRDEDAARKLEAELGGVGKKTLAIVAELTNAESCRQAVEQATRSTGEIDALINNAGVNDRVGLEGGSPAEYVASLERNLLHYYNVAHYALPWLKKAHGTCCLVAEVLSTNPSAQRLFETAGFKRVVALQGDAVTVNRYELIVPAGGG